MIYTVTFNPAIDYLVYVPELSVGSIIRSEKESTFCGGKGINVSLILQELGIESTATGFLAGFTGSAIEQALSGGAIRTDFVHLKEGLTRINVKIRSGQETDINARGPAISDSEIGELLKKLEILKSGDILVLAGSIPNTLPSDIYEKIMEQLSGRGIRFVVDATGDLLINSLKYASIATNIGDVRTLVIHPASTIYTHSTEEQRVNAGVFDDSIRISVGIEDIDDLIEDFRQAIDKANGGN